MLCPCPSSRLVSVLIVSWTVAYVNPPDERPLIVFPAALGPLLENVDKPAPARTLFGNLSCTHILYQWRATNQPSPITPFNMSCSFPPRLCYDCEHPYRLDPSSSPHGPAKPGTSLAMSLTA
ncbi:hypothetical protein AcV5_000497 [Taiwanofungus camphoratus]|nr:hypothetical protein AcV5_000497 [Antrodia cinnamomea]